jgi:ribose transport system substrate-binding protein
MGRLESGGLEDHGLAGRVIQVGFDSSKKLIEALEKKELKGLVLQDPVRMGYDSVRTAAACLRGQPYEKVIDTGVVLVTAENMDSPEIKALLEPDFSKYLDR